MLVERRGPESNRRIAVLQTCDRQCDQWPSHGITGSWAVNQWIVGGYRTPSLVIRVVIRGMPLADPAACRVHDVRPLLRSGIGQNGATRGKPSGSRTPRDSPVESRLSAASAPGFATKAHERVSNPLWRVAGRISAEAQNTSAAWMSVRRSSRTRKHRNRLNHAPAPRAVAAGKPLPAQLMLRPRRLPLSEIQQAAGGPAARAHSGVATKC